MLKAPLLSTRTYPLRFPRKPFSTKPQPLSRVRTFVCPRPHVAVVGVRSTKAFINYWTVGAADDVDGAGGIDHGRVPSSGTPRRAGGAQAPRHACGTRAERPMSANARVSVRPSPLRY